MRKAVFSRQAKKIFSFFRPWQLCLVYLDSNLIGWGIDKPFVSFRNPVDLFLCGAWCLITNKLLQYLPVFLKQVVIQRGIPFEMKLSSARPLVIGELTREQFNAEMQAGLDDIQAGHVVSADEVEAEMRRMYGA